MSTWPSERRGGHHLRRDHAAGTGNVLHDEGLAEPAGELLRQQPREHIGIAARRRGRDQAHGPVGIFAVGAGEDATQRQHD